MNKFRKIFLTALFLCGLILASCVSNQKKATKLIPLIPSADIKKANETTAKVQKGMVESAGKIDSETYRIRGATNSIEQNTPEKSLPKIGPHIKDIRSSVSNIDKQTAEIRRLSGELERTKAALSIANDKVDVQEAQLKLLTEERDGAFKERDKAVAISNDATQKSLRGIIVVTVIIGGVGIGVWWYFSKKVGLMLIVAAAGTLVLAVTVSKYLDQIALAGLGLMVVCVGILLWRVFVQKKALTEVVHTAEVAKRNLPAPARMKIFGYKSEPGDAFKIQSSSTEKEVANIRKELKKKFDPVIDDPTLVEMEDYDREIRADQEVVAAKTARRSTSRRNRSTARVR